MRRVALSLVLIIACSCGGEDPAPEAGSAPAAEAGQLSQDPEAMAPSQAAADAGAAGADAPVGEPFKTPTGLVITHEVIGDGARPKASDRVRVHYHGTFPDGSVFDSSVSRGEPAVFPLNRVIPCWTEGVQLMRVGGRAKLECPPYIAYGAQGAPPAIPPNATLLFDVQLLGIE